MIDPRVLRDEPDRVRAAMTKRGLSDDVVDRALKADEARRGAIAEFEAKRAEQKQLGKLIPQAQGDEKQQLLARTKSLAADVKAAEAAQGEAEDEWRAAIMDIPNLAADEAPAGGEDDFTVLEHVGTPREFDFEPRDHIELGKLLGAIDVERGAKVSGSRFYYLTGVGADLEFALVNMAMDQAREAGFTTMIPPTLVKPRAMEGTGFLGQAADDVYRIEGQDMYLVGTSEVPLAAYHSDEILDAGTLPLRYARSARASARRPGRTARTPGGSSGCTGSTRSRCSPTRPVEDSYAEHQRLLGWEKQWLDELELAYRVDRRGRRRPRPVGPAEVRLRGVDPDPGPVPRAHLRVELHRLPDPPPRHPCSLRGWREAAGHPQRHALVAIPRTIVAILETHQQADGSVRVPKALRPYLQDREVLEAPGG